MAHSSLPTMDFEYWCSDCHSSREGVCLHHLTNFIPPTFRMNGGCSSSEIYTCQSQGRQIPQEELIVLTSEGLTSSNFETGVESEQPQAEGSCLRCPSTGSRGETHNSEHNRRSYQHVPALKGRDVLEQRSSETGKAQQALAKFCGICGRSFKRKHDLARHRKSHQPHKSMYCGCCDNACKANQHGSGQGYGTDRKDHLKQHLRKGKHKVLSKSLPYECLVEKREGVTEFAFSSVHCLLEHMQRYHPKDPSIHRIMDEAAEANPHNEQSTCRCNWRRLLPTLVANSHMQGNERFNSSQSSSSEAPPIGDVWYLPQAALAVAEPLTHADMIDQRLRRGPDSYR